MTPIPPAHPSPGALPPPLPPTGDATGGIIPYKNPRALTAYYLAVFSIIPAIGFLLGAAAVVLGIMGLKQRKRNPVIRGAVHAWIGIIGGGLSVALHLLVAILITSAR